MNPYKLFARERRFWREIEKEVSAVTTTPRKCNRWQILTKSLHALVVVRLGSRGLSRFDWGQTRLKRWFVPQRRVWLGSDFNKRIATNKERGERMAHTNGGADAAAILRGGPRRAVRYDVESASEKEQSSRLPVTVRRLIAAGPSCDANAPGPAFCQTTSSWSISISDAAPKQHPHYIRVPSLRGGSAGSSDFYRVLSGFTWFYDHVNLEGVSIYLVVLGFDSIDFVLSGFSECLWVFLRVRFHLNGFLIVVPYPNGHCFVLFVLLHEFWVVLLSSTGFWGVLLSSTTIFN